MDSETVIVGEAPFEGAESEVLADDENIFAPDDDSTDDTAAGDQDEESDGDEDVDYSEEEDGAEDENIFDDEDEEADDDDDDDEDDTPQRPDTASAQVQADAAAAMLAGKGIDYNTLVDEYLNGGISEKSLKALSAAGYSKDVIDSYISGQQAKYDLYVRDVETLVGGREAYTKMCRWAMKNISKEEQDEFDRAVESMDIGRAKFAVNALIARKQMATGKAPELVKAKASKQSGVKPYNNVDEISKALDDSRYGSDPKYTKMVDARLMATPY